MNKRKVKATKRYILVLACLVFCHAYSDKVFAGGAAKMRQQKSREAMQQRMVQQQMIQMQQMKRQQAIIQQQAILKQQAMQKTATADMVAYKVGEEMAHRNAAVADVVELNQLVAALERSSHPWELVIDDEAKEAVVHYYINRYRQEGVRINKGPLFYVQLIDAMAQQQPEMLVQPFSSLLKILSIIEYDFDNGQNKDFLVRQVLGEQGYLENKKRLGRI